MPSAKRSSAWQVGRRPGALVLVLSTGLVATVEPSAGGWNAVVGHRCDGPHTSESDAVAAAERRRTEVLSNDAQVLGRVLGFAAADEDPAWPLADWRVEVLNGDTRLGYADWVAHARESEAGAGPAG